MKPFKISRVAGLAATVVFVNAPSLAAPGEDPVTITGKVAYLQVPIAAPPRSTELVQRTGMPDYAQAKIARYVAKAYAPDTGDVKTEKDVITTTKTNGLRTTCVQSLAPSPSAPPGGALMNNDQVVVLRGDLVNFCN